MADERPNIGKTEVYERTIELMQDKSEYKEIIENILDATEATHEDHDREDPDQVDYRNITPNLGKLSYLKRRGLLFKPIDTHTWKVWEFTNKEVVEKAVEDYEREKEKVQGTFEREQANSVLQTSLTPQDRERFKELAREEDMLEYWAPYINPHIRNMLPHKRALLTSIASLDSRYGYRGQSHTLLVGPPGTGKSRLLYWIADKLGYDLSSHRTSEVGLTGDARGDKITPGDLPKAHGGVLCIDELDKFEKKDLNGLDEAMSDGKVTISAGGKKTRFKAEATVLAAANKTEGFPAHLKSRFDLVLKCEHPPKSQAEDILGPIYMNWRREQRDYSGQKLRKFLSWIKEFTPQADMQTRRALKKAGLEYMRRTSEDRVKTRKHERFLRIGWAIARLNHRDIRVKELERAWELCPDAQSLTINIS